jgi:hypothetical protein
MAVPARRQWKTVTVYLSTKDIEYKIARTGRRARRANREIEPS